MEGKSATLILPYFGYKRIEIIHFCPNIYKWECVIMGSGKIAYFYEDEFEID